MQRRGSVDTKKIGHLGGSLAVFGRIIGRSGRGSDRTSKTNAPGPHQARTRPPGPHQARSDAAIVLYFFLAMIEFFTVNKVCDFLTLKTKKTWEAKYEILTELVD